MIKKFVVTVAAVIISVCCAFSCAAVEIDGAPGNAEWSGAQSYSFESPTGFNNNVKFALLRIIPNVEANQFFLCVTMSLSEFADANNSGVILYFNGGEAIRLNGDGTTDYDVVLYNAEYAMTYDELTKTITYEIIFGAKFGIPSENQLSVQLCDCSGAPSNVFSFDLDTINENTTENNNENEEVKTTKKAKANKTKASKTTSVKDDNFTFKKVETDKTSEADEQSESVTETVNLTNKAVDNSSIKRNVLTATGVICALAVATCAVYSGIKKSQEKADKK